MLNLPDRSKKPRTVGITAITDTGLNIAEQRAMLEDYGDYLDVAKFGVGSAYVTPKLREKVMLYQEFNVRPYLGGTLFEKFYYQGKLSEYVSYLRDLDVSWLEISNGTIEISLEERVRICEELSSDFTVVSEVGCKDAEKIMPPSEWIEEMSALLAAGSSYVITEGRDSGTAGVYRPSGEIRTGLIADIAHEIDPQRIIFEAPITKAQMYFIDIVGPDVNLGNIHPTHLLILEAQRVGLRSETFFLGEDRHTE